MKLDITTMCIYAFGQETTKRLVNNQLKGIVDPSVRLGDQVTLNRNILTEEHDILCTRMANLEKSLSIKVIARQHITPEDQAKLDSFVDKTRTASEIIKHFDGIATNDIMYDNTNKTYMLRAMDLDELFLPVLRHYFLHPVDIPFHKKLDRIEFNCSGVIARRTVIRKQITMLKEMNVSVLSFSLPDLIQIMQSK